MNRRNFIRQTAAGTAWLTLGSAGVELLSENEVHLTILHTNDVHSYVDPFPANHPKFAGRGGVARRAQLIADIRTENPNTLLFDAGDIFQGTPYFNFYGGELEFKLMSLMRYDLATLGNHDFDNGIDGLVAQLPHANFDFVSANYDFSNTILEGKVAPYKILKKAGLRIGVFGLGINLLGLVDKKLYKETKYLDPIEITEETVRILRQKRCDLIVCLSHLGFEYTTDPNRISDRKLAAATDGIDLIIGGHTHTFLEKPVVAENRNGQKVVINQTGCYGVNLGRIDFYFSRNGKKVLDGRSIQI